jgi:hypothetical protein
MIDKRLEGSKEIGVAVRKDAERVNIPVAVFVTFCRETKRRVGDAPSCDLRASARQRSRPVRTIGVCQMHRHRHRPFQTTGLDDNPSTIQAEDQMASDAVVEARHHRYLE